MTPGVPRYWIAGTMWHTKEACEESCKVIHHRLGMKEAPVEVVKAEDFLAARQAVCELAEMVMKHEQQIWDNCADFADDPRSECTSELYQQARALKERYEQEITSHTSGPDPA